MSVACEAILPLAEKLRCRISTGGFLWLGPGTVRGTFECNPLEASWSAQDTSNILQLSFRVRASSLGIFELHRRVSGRVALGFLRSFRLPSSPSVVEAGESFSIDVPDDICIAVSMRSTSDDAAGLASFLPGSLRATFQRLSPSFGEELALQAEGRARLASGAVVTACCRARVDKGLRALLWPSVLLGNAIDIDIATPLIAEPVDSGDLPVCESVGVE
jgi:hypothetical protein